MYIATVPAVTNAEMDWMRTCYVVEIEKLRQVFGDVKMSWGLHIYFM